MTTAVRGDLKRELLIVGAVWLVVFGAAVGALLALHYNALDIINHIEYVRAGRYQRVTALYHEAGKHADKLMQKAMTVNAPSETKVLISQSDPDYVAAINLYRRAIALDPRDEFAPERRPYLEKMANVYEAGGDEVNQVNALARAFIAEGDYRNALTYLNALVSRNQKHVESWKLMVEAALRQKDATNTEHLLARMEQAGASPVDLAYYRGRLALLRNKPDEAVQFFSKAVAGAPKDMGLRQELGSLLMVKKKYDEAVQVLSEGLKHGGSRDPEYLHVLGNALLGANKPSEAIEQLENAIEFERNSASVYWSLAQAYQRIGKTRKSNSALQEALRLDPSLRDKVLN